MLITPRTYITSQRPDRGLSLSNGENSPRFHSLTGWRADFADARRAAEMLLIYQAGSVRVGEAVRYTLTYTPSSDPILPTPGNLYVKVKNTSATPLRAAYLHGPYTLYAACYPSTFDPNVKYDQDKTEGIPQFEPYVKAGGSWDAAITIPENLRQLPQQPSSTDQVEGGSGQSVTWIIEIVSQVIFSTTATVHFELLVGRDETSIDIGSVVSVSSNGLPPPAQVHDHWSSQRKGVRALASKGVYSRSITLAVDDTASLWNTPPLPSGEETGDYDGGISLRSDAAGTHVKDTEESSQPKTKRKKRIHLVILTHGLHSNLGADMLYLKESIDTAARKAREQAKAKRRQRRADRSMDALNGLRSSDEMHDNGGDDHDDDDDGEDEDEKVVVRGFPGNAVRTERGIQYLGKRLAKYVLLMTYPDQPYLPPKTSKGKSISKSFTGLSGKGGAEPVLNALHSTEPGTDGNRSDIEHQTYRVSSISFVGHSLGGLIQTYAIAYIHKYSPEFFDRIKPVNFIALATPFLGLSNENPIYVRFALDFGLVGRTGQDLGLSWTAPKVRSGWGAMIGGKGGESPKTQGPSGPGSKPLLRILPSGPAHEVLLKFRHRTVYSNVVNDGIVPLRTSCLLFLDWRGLDRVEKARRENGLVGTMAEWGWAELTGANSKSPQTLRPADELAFGDASNDGECIKTIGSSLEVSSPRTGLVGDDSPSDIPLSPTPGQSCKQSDQSQLRRMAETRLEETSTPLFSLGPLSSILSIFRSKEVKHTSSHKHAKIYKRSQTLSASNTSVEEMSPKFPTSGLMGSVNEGAGLNTPPKTTFFESAGDLLMPPLPPTEFILDPSSRPRTIFHDRIYHPEDIPPPLPVKRRTLAFGSMHSKDTKHGLASPTGHDNLSSQSWKEPESGLRVEEKIARAYHRDLSWRKVLVRLEPDAHNNIIVRRMFTNAYGWPVVKHLVDTHFGYTSTAHSDDTQEQSVERAEPTYVRTTVSGNEVEGQTDPPIEEPSSEISQRSREDPKGCFDNTAAVPANLPHMFSMQPSMVRADDRSQTPSESIDGQMSCSSGVSRHDSAKWSDRYFDDNADDDND